MSHEHTRYGYFLGGDPRDFWPDHECSTEAERTAHTLACRLWDEASARGEELAPEPNYHQPLAEGVAFDAALVLPGGGGYGLGTQTWQCDEPDCEGD